MDWLGKNDEEVTLAASSAHLGWERLEQVLGASVKSNAGGNHLSVHCWFGNPPPITLQAEAVRLLAPEAADDAACIERWLFLDTETTGRKGDTGMCPFLVGLGWWEGGGLEVEQLLMREAREERSVLVAIAERLAERPVLVTYNGKSFDWPLLKMRYRRRRISLPPLMAHLDFLHPARNLWRSRLGSAKLSHLERHVLGWERGADVIASRIPRAYFEFVCRGNADGLIPVFEHNQMDLRGLAGVAARVLTLLADDDCTGKEALELFGASCVCGRGEQPGRARKLCEQSIRSGLPAQADQMARMALARLAKREGDMESACQVWRSAVGNSRQGYEAYEQLASYFEHKGRQPQKALEIVRQALAELSRAQREGTILSRTFLRTQARFERRRQRLERKTRQVLTSVS
jgi:uncharacterized protein